MMIGDKKIRVAIWKTRLPSAKSVLIIILLVATFAFAILHKIPVGPEYNVTKEGAFTQCLAGQASFYHSIVIGREILGIMHILIPDLVAIVSPVVPIGRDETCYS